MGKVKSKLIDWKNRLKKGHMLSIIVVLFSIIVILAILIYKKQTEYRQASENSYNMAFYEVVDYVQNVEVFLAKSLITNSPESSAESLTNVWREANLAQAYLAQLPISSNELENTNKFLNQVSEYSYSLYRKNLNDEELSDEDLKNLKDLLQKKYHNTLFIETKLCLQKNNIKKKLSNISKNMKKQKTYLEKMQLDLIVVQLILHVG